MRAFTDRELLALSSCTCLLIYFVPGEIAGIVHVLLFGTKVAFMLYVLVRDRHGFWAPPHVHAHSRVRYPDNDLENRDALGV